MTDRMRWMGVALLSAAMAWGCSSAGPGADADGGTDAGVDGGADRGADPGDRDPLLDPCPGTICDDPPESVCGEKGELIVYEALGDCDHADGQCRYDPIPFKCLNPCQDAHCEGLDLCAANGCYAPPSPMCGADGVTLTLFERSGTCEPSTGRCDYPSREERCAVACRFGRCQPPEGSDAALQVPAGFAACTFFWGGEVLGVYPEKGQLRLREGLYPLRLDGSENSIDWLESLRLTPLRTEAVPVGPAVGIARVEGSGSEERTVLEIEQELSLGQKTYFLTGTVEFEVLDGRVTQPVVDLSAAPWSGGVGRARIKGMLMPDGFMPSYSPCDRLDEPQATRLTAANGDVVTLGYAFAPLGCMDGFACAGEPYPGRILEAVFTRGATTRTVTDFFDLEFTTIHHWDGRSFLVRFDEPIGNVAALLIPRDLESGEAVEIHYLDGDLALIEKQAIVSTE